MKAEQPLVIRADANTRMGTGHVMRCIALAQAWQETGGRVQFVVADLPASLKTRLEAEDMAVQTISSKAGSADDAQQLSRIAHQQAAQWVVVDGYQFGVDYQQVIKAQDLKLLVIDDYGQADHYVADIILNQNISASAQFYPSYEPYTQLLLGTDYALLRREFWPYRDYQRQIAPVASKILVTLGGSDPDNVTLKVILALQQIKKDMEVVVVVGGSNPHYETLRQAVCQTPHSIRLEQNVTNMPDLMAWADLAISAGGSTCWELAFMGLPAILIILAENQRLLSEKLAHQQIALNLGWHTQVTLTTLATTIDNLRHLFAQRRTMTRLGQELVDGWGGTRVLNYLGA